MPGSTTPIDLTSPPPTTIEDTLMLDKTVEKRPSATDLHHSPKKQKTTIHEPPTPELTVSPAPTEGLVGIDIPVPKITSIPTHEVPRLMVKLLSKKGRVPTRGSAFAAGYDVYSAETITISPRNRALVSTDISIACPPGTYGRIAPRSGLAVKNFIDTGAGVIDADYRGVVKVLLFNHADAEFVVNEGDRIAQLILERIHTPEMVAVDELPESIRGAGGFGSTGGHASLV